MFDFTTVATLIAVVATAVIGGVLFAFSSFVMRGLARLTPAEGIRAMQSINITAVSPVFMTVLFGTAVLAITVAIAHPTAWTVAGAALYVLGVIGVTAVANVPRNNALAGVDALAAGAADAWHSFLVGWQRWNHVRCIAGVASSSAFLIAAVA